MFKSVCLALSVAVASVSLASWPTEAEAKRLGGGKPAGTQRSTPDQPNQASPQTPGQPGAQAQPGGMAAQPGAAAAAQAGNKRSWMGPLAGLAAGLGIAALLSHFGLGEAFADALMMVLLLMVVVAVGVWLLRKFKGQSAANAGNAGTGPQLAGAGAPWSNQGTANALRSAPTQAAGSASSLFAGLQGSGLQSAGTNAHASTGTVASASSIPADFDAAGFERIAKMIFIRMQAANDAADLEDLRKFTTPELFASLRLDIQERGNSQQQTDVVQLEARLADLATEGSQQVASVRYSGMIREEQGAAAENFAEVWHLVRPLDASSEWRIAGITPLQ